MKFSFYQGDSQVNFNYDVNPSNKNKVFGTVLNDLFRTISLQSVTGAKFFKLNQPIMVRIESDMFLLDTGTAHKTAQQRLKLNSKAKSKKAFAKKFVAIADFILHKPELITVDALNKVLDAEIAG